MALALLTTKLNFINKKNRASAIHEICTFNVQINQNKHLIRYLSLKLEDTCSVNEPFKLQNNCNNLFLKIEDLYDSNRSINVLKRDIYKKYNIDWDEEYN